VAFAGDAVGDHAGHLHRAVVAQAVHQRTGGLRHRAGVDHRHHRYAEFARQVGGGGRAVVQAHDAFDQDHVRFGGGLRQLAAAQFMADHPQVE
jgi:hypothetical protein